MYRIAALTSPIKRHPARWTNICDSDFVAQRTPRNTLVRARRPIHVRRCEPLINRIGARAKLPFLVHAHMLRHAWRLCPRERGARHTGSLLLDQGMTGLIRLASHWSSVMREQQDVN